MANFDYFKQYVSEMERIKAQTAHEEHIIEFRAMCAKMIEDATPKIKEHVKQELMQDLEHKQRSEFEKQVSKHHIHQQDKPARVRITNVDEVVKNIKDAIRRAFK